MTIFLQKRGSLGDRSKTEGAIMENLDNFNFFPPNTVLAVICIFFFKISWCCLAILIEKAKIGDIGCKVVKKGGIWWQANVEKGVYWYTHDINLVMGVPPPDLLCITQKADKHSRIEVPYMCVIGYLLCVLRNSAHNHWLSHGLLTMLTTFEK